jgi:hypothetical protein
MNAGKTVVQFFLAWIALLAAQMVAGMLIHTSTPVMPNIFRWLMLSNALVVMALGAAAMRSEWKRWRLGLALFSIPVVIAAVNMLEGVIFLTNAKVDWRGIFLLTVAGYALAAALWTVLFNRKPVLASADDWAIPTRTFPQNLWRFAFCSAAYVFLYILAGTIIFPYVREYYATQHIPSMGQLVSLQLFVRGPVFVLVCLGLLRMFRLNGWSSALSVGLAFTILSGVATLILPNPFFPDSVRWAHFCEVTSSNFVFGCVVGLVWGKPATATAKAKLTAQPV